MLTRVLLLVILATAGCAEFAPNDEPKAAVDTLASGLVRVVNNGAPAWTPEEAWHLEEDLRLGTAEGAGLKQFSRIMSLLVDPAGMIYVLDLFSQEIRVFTPDGTFSHLIGGRGEGPGEFEDAIGMSFGPDGMLWVNDPLAQCYSAFTRDGSFAGSFPRRLQGYIRYSPGQFLSDGSYFDWGIGFPEERPGVAAGSRILYHPVLLTADFQIRDSLPALEYHQEMMANGTRPQPYFSGRLAVAVDRMGAIWFADTREYRIYRRTLTGDTTLLFERPAEPVKVGEAERKYVRSTRVRPELIPSYIEALPGTKPIIRRILLDGAGHVLVFPEVAAAPGGMVVDVFRESGHFLGRLALPDPVPAMPDSPLIAFATPTHLFLVVKDEFAVSYVSRLRIVRAP